MASISALLHGVHGGGEPLVAARQQHQGCARFGQSFGYLLAEAAGASGHQGHLAREIEQLFE